MGRSGPVLHSALGPGCCAERAARRDPRGDVAQLEERRVRIAEARGSSPLISTNRPLRRRFLSRPGRLTRYAAGESARQEEPHEPMVDPVAAPDAYQQLLLSYLGDDDPAVVQAATPAAIRAVVAAAGPDLRRRPAPTEWSVVECLGHMVDGELVVSGRYRWIVAEAEPDIVGYDQNLWVDRLRHGQDDPAELLGLFSALRRVNFDLGPASRPRIGPGSASIANAARRVTS